jgi:lipoprotein-anchoring transpeptidase ErfK/SrfK
LKWIIKSTSPKKFLPMSRDYSFARSFMWMSFATAGLMVASQMGAFSALTANALSPSPSSIQAEEERSQLVVDLSDRKVHLYADGIQTDYDIAVGQAGWETPAGKFSILNMQLNPTWQHPFTGDIIQTGIDNPLGSRWIGFWTDGTHQIGFHGTNQADLIGQAVSHGCIRMRDADIQALYERVAIGTAVVVQP